MLRGEPKYSCGIPRMSKVTVNKELMLRNSKNASNLKKKMDIQIQETLPRMNPKRPTQ